jgi:hypothetical protein
MECEKNIPLNNERLARSGTVHFSMAWGGSLFSLASAGEGISPFPSLSRVEIGLTG